MHVDDEISHMGVVNGLLRLGPPGRISGGVVRINANDIELIDILEFGPLQIGELAAEDEMEQLSAGMLIRHDLAFRLGIGPAATAYPNSASHSRVSATSATWRSAPAATTAPWTRFG